MQAGGDAAMLHDLQARNLTSFNIRRVPQTDALRSQKMLSLTSMESWWLTVSGARLPLREQARHTCVRHVARLLLERAALQKLFPMGRPGAPALAKLTRRDGQVHDKGCPARAPPLRRPLPDRRDRVPRPRVLKAGGSLSEHGVAYHDHPPGYQVGALADARAAFETAFPETVL
jgi:hypothetical protein